MALISTINWASAKVQSAGTTTRRFIIAYVTGPITYEEVSEVEVLIVKACTLSACETAAAAAPPADGYTYDVQYTRQNETNGYDCTRTKTKKTLGIVGA